MKKLRWVMDGGFWDLDLSTPITVDGVARPVPGHTVPLGLSRGTKLTRPKQIDFMQRFMFMPFIPSYASAGNGFSLQRVAAFSFTQNWFFTLLGQFNLQKFVSSVKHQHTGSEQVSWLDTIGTQLCNKSMYALALCSEFWLSPDDTLLMTSQVYGGDEKTRRTKAVYHHKFPQHNLTVEAAWPGLFEDKSGTYWDVPSLVEVDLASVPSDSGPSYRFCAHHRKGDPKRFDGDQVARADAALHPGLSLKSAFSIKKNIDIWRSKEGKLKMVQPFDAFLSEPHISASGILGTIMIANLGTNPFRSQGQDVTHALAGINFVSLGNKSALSADCFATVSCTAQHGNFQRLFLDLTRVHARLDFPSGSTLLSGAARLAHDLYNSQKPDLDAIQAVCPKVTMSFQQQIFGEFSFRVDSILDFDLKKSEWRPELDETIYAIEYAMQVLGSAKAVAWYSSKNKQAMVELRFFES